LLNPPSAFPGPAPTDRGGSAVALQAWINRFAFQRQHTEGGFMHPAQRFFTHETFKGFHAKSKFAERQGALGGKSSCPQAVEMSRCRVLRAIDDAQILPSAAFHRGLQKAAPAASDKIQRLDDHPFAALRRE